MSQANQGVADRFDARSIPLYATESTWRCSDGALVRRIDWPGTTPDRGSILFLPGRGDAYEKYLETLDDWHRAGWRVTAADWRGQAGSGRLGADSVTGHVNDFAAWVSDLAELWQAWTAETPPPHVIAGHSMGGHLVLRALAEGRIDPAAAVLSAPMLGIAGQRLPAPVLHGAARAMAALGDPRRPAWKWSEKPGEVPAGRSVLLTHDERRYADELWWREHRPELVMGPGSWRWVERAYASMRLLARPGVLERVTVPVLIVATRADALVSWPAIARAAQRLPNTELLAFGPEAAHEILREVDPIRDRAMAAIDDFLARTTPPVQR